MNSTVSVPQTEFYNGDTPYEKQVLYGSAFISTIWMGLLLIYTLINGYKKNMMVGLKQDLIWYQISNLIITIDMLSEDINRLSVSSIWTIHVALEFSIWLIISLGHKISRVILFTLSYIVLAVIVYLLPYNDWFAAYILLGFTCDLVSTIALCRVTYAVYLQEYTFAYAPLQKRSAMSAANVQRESAVQQSDKRRDAAYEFKYWIVLLCCFILHVITTMLAFWIKDYIMTFILNITSVIMNSLISYFILESNKEQEINVAYKWLILEFVCAIIGAIVVGIIGMYI
jgi:hypothetical protein